MHRKSLLYVLISLTFGVMAIQACSISPTPIADLTIINAQIYPGPGEPPSEAANISISDGKITAIYSGTPLNSAVTIDAGGRTVTAGLWNSHVHFTDPRLQHSAEQMVRDMFLRYGFTTVIDAGSELQETLTLKKRIDTGEFPGPRILTANGSFVFTNGTPSYLPGVKLPEIDQPEQAAPLVADVLDSGADGIKIFSGSFQGPHDPIYLPPNIIRAIANAAHSRRSFVMSHPTDRTGLVNAVENGVDVLAHTAPQAGLFGRDLIATMKKNSVAVIPTLTLWRVELERAGVKSEGALAFQSIGVKQLSEFVDADGEVLFGTDAGYIDVFDTAEELQLMHAAGMTFDAILAAMTTVPANRFLQENARLAESEPADIVIFASSPAQDATGFSQVAYTIKGGRVVYRGDEYK